MPKVYNWYDTKYIKVPDVTDMILEDANNLLKGFDVRYVGSGKRVIKQEPLPNTLRPDDGKRRIWRVAPGEIEDSVEIWNDFKENNYDIAVQYDADGQHDSKYIKDNWSSNNCS